MQFDDPARTDDHARPNLTPMIDVIFLLIIFFMTVARLTASVSTAPVDLPAATEADAGAASPPGRVIVNVFGDGRLALGDEAVTLARLREYLAVAAQQATAGGAPVLIRADRRAPLGAVKRVVQACLAAGARELAFGAQPTEPPSLEPAP